MPGSFLGLGGCQRHCRGCCGGSARLGSGVVLSARSRRQLIQAGRGHMRLGAWCCSDGA